MCCCDGRGARPRLSSGERARLPQRGRRCESGASSGSWRALMRTDGGFEGASSPSLLRLITAKFYIAQIRAREVVASAEAVATVHTPSEMSELSPRMSNAHDWLRCVEGGCGVTNRPRMCRRRFAPMSPWLLRPRPIKLSTELSRTCGARGAGATLRLSPLTNPVGETARCLVVR